LQIGRKFHAALRIYVAPRRLVRARNEPIKKDRSCRKEAAELW